MASTGCIIVGASFLMVINVFPFATPGRIVRPKYIDLVPKQSVEHLTELKLLGTEIPNVASESSFYSNLL